MPPLIDDQTIPPDAALLRVLRQDPRWTTNENGRIRPTSLVFFSATEEISYFVDMPGIVDELQRIFPGHKIARVPVSAIRAVGFAIERRPTECPADFQSDRACHVIAGPALQSTRLEYQRRARSIAKNMEVTIIDPEAQAPPEAGP
jgi:hypothetical protein